MKEKRERRWKVYSFDLTDEKTFTNLGIEDAGDCLHWIDTNTGIDDHHLVQIEEKGMLIVYHPTFEIVEPGAWIPQIDVEPNGTTVDVWEDGY